MTLETRPSSRAFGLGPVSAVLMLVGASACGPLEEPADDSAPILTQSAQALEAENGLAFNGLAFNGLAFNGLAFNGLAFNGLSNTAFMSWFNADPTLANTVMKYVIGCAVPSGQTRTYTGTSGTTYVWPGMLGLAPDWSGGKPASVKEQQLISGCLAAHVNKFGRKVPISVQGRDSRGQPVVTSQKELQEFSQREGCFFGNLFTGEGVFAGNDDRTLRGYESSVRACALESGNGGCDPIPQVGTCGSRCTLDASGTFYTQCTYKGVSYAPVTTRIHTQDVYSCGDGVCQFTESCGVGLTTERCSLDCGICL